MNGCKGMNCGCTDGVSHSLECHAEHAAAIAGGVFVKGAQREQPAASKPVESVERWNAAQELLGRYWELAFREGRDGINLADEANQVLYEFRTLLTAESAEQREQGKTGLG